MVEKYMRVKFLTRFKFWCHRGGLRCSQAMSNCIGAQCEIRKHPKWIPAVIDPTADRARQRWEYWQYCTGRCCA